MYLRRLRAGAVEEDGEKADGDVQDLAGDLVSVNLSTSTVGSQQGWCVYSRMTAIFGGLESSLEDSDSCSFPSSNSCSLALVTGGRLKCCPAV